MDTVFLTRLSILCLLVFSSVLLFTKDICILSILTFLILLSSVFLDKKGKLFSRIKFLFIAAIFIFLFQVFLNTSQPFATRLIQGFTSAIKITALSMSVFIITLFFSINQITKALSFLPRKILLMIVITFSLMPSIFEEAQKILLVQNSRGHNTKSLNIFKAFLPFIIPLLHKTLHRAEQISITIESRGYKNEK